MTRFRYFGVFECPQFTCHTDVNLVNREANLYFQKLVFFVLTFCGRNQPVLNLFLTTVSFCNSSCNAGLFDEIVKVQKGHARIILHAAFSG